MTRIYVGPTTLYALGQVGELDLLQSFDGRLVVPDVVQTEVTTEPARSAMESFLDDTDVSTAVPNSAHEQATGVVGIEDGTHEAAMLAGVVAHSDPDDRHAVAVVSEDRRVRRIEFVACALHLDSLAQVPISPAWWFARSCWVTVVDSGERLEDLGHSRSAS